MQVTANSSLPSLHVSNSLHHFQVMMGPLGLYQHATYFSPLLSEGYCTDDNARAVTMLLHLRPLVPTAEQHLIEGLLDKCWTFIVEAQEDEGRFYNFRSVDGKWLPMGRSEDMYARIMRAAVSIITLDKSEARLAQARSILLAGIGSGHWQAFTAPRAWAESLLNISLLPRADFEEVNGESLITQGFLYFQDLWARHALNNWPWFETSMTYANALLPHGLLAALSIKPDETIAKIVRQSTAFLLETTIKKDLFIPVGNAGWYFQGGKAAIEHQQPIEASLMFDFLLDYCQIYPEHISLDKVSKPYLWFFGLNMGNVLMADEAMGACRDGLFIEGLNENHGAESMLAYLWAEIRARQSPASLQKIIAHQRNGLARKIHPSIKTS